jgi:hypothetical protein
MGTGLFPEETKTPVLKEAVLNTVLLEMYLKIYIILSAKLFITPLDLKFVLISI